MCIKSLVSTALEPLAEKIYATNGGKPTTKNPATHNNEPYRLFYGWWNSRQCRQRCKQQFRKCTTAIGGLTGGQIPILAVDAICRGLVVHEFRFLWPPSVFSFSTIQCCGLGVLSFLKILHNTNLSMKSALCNEKSPSSTANSIDKNQGSSAQRLAWFCNTNRPCHRILQHLHWRRRRRRRRLRCCCCRRRRRFLPSRPRPLC